MNESAILAQSKAAINQWGEQWKAQAKEHSKFPMKSLEDFRNIGIGKAVLCVANGYSFEENIETIKKYRDNVDIICCDKTLGHLLDNGIKPDYCLICDANVNYEAYMHKYADQLQDTIALVNVCANPKWTHNGNWKDIYFFINKDILKSEQIFSEISGCKNFIPAGTNVSNAMVVMLTQSDNDGRKNFFGYDKILLIGYDYSWKFGGKYYAFNEDGGGKANYMKHAYCIATDGSYTYTSGNLAFSAEWFETYVTAFNLPVIQCSRSSILRRVKLGNLEQQMQYRYKPEHAGLVREQIEELIKVTNLKRQIEHNLKSIEREHKHAFLASV